MCCECGHDPCSGQCPNAEPPKEYKCVRCEEYYLAYEMQGEICKDCRQELENETEEIMMTLKAIYDALYALADTEIGTVTEAHFNPKEEAYNAVEIKATPAGTNRTLVFEVREEKSHV